MKVKRLFIAAAALVSGLLLTVALMLMTTGQNARANPGTIYVDHEASSPAPDGLSWTTAFTELQTALAVAVAGDEIWVAEGIYYPDYDPNSGQYTGIVSASFVLEPDIALYGGFAGTETSLDQRDWRANVTILSGDLDRDDLSSGGIVTVTTRIRGDNAWSVMRTTNGAERAVLDGFTITAGDADNDEPVVWYDASICGGGMYLIGIPTLRNLAFFGNNAIGSGGALFASGSSTVTNAIFNGNASIDGGAVATWVGSTTFVNALFTRNVAPYGGAMYNLIGGNYPTLINATFFDNSAEWGGAIYNGLGGGGDSTLTLTNCILWDNWAVTGTQIHNAAGTPFISHSDVEGSAGSGAGWDAALGTDGGGNVDVDPSFVDADGGDLRLDLNSSPVIDAGDSDAVLNGTVTDLDGDPRFVNILGVPDTGSGDPPIVDMGAYEVQSSATPWIYTLEICTDESWYEPSTGQHAEIQTAGPAPGSIYDIPGAEPIWGQDDSPNSSTVLTRSFTIPTDTKSLTGVVTFVADDGVTLTLNSEVVGNYDAQVWPPPTTATLTALQPGTNEFQAEVYNRPGSAWFEACAEITYEWWSVYVPLVMRGN